MRKGAPSTRVALEKVPTADWARFLRHIDSALTEWVRESGLEFPVECNVLEARR